MLDTSTAVLEVHQFGYSDSRDLLYLFALPANVLHQWAGIPRKGWHIRMLYQRSITEVRKRELTEFWTRAAKGEAAHPNVSILGPTAITLAIQDAIVIENGRMQLRYTAPIDFAADPILNLKKIASIVLPRVAGRLPAEKRALLSSFDASPLGELPDVEHDYVLEFALQLTQMVKDPQWFVDENAIEPEELKDMIVALEALCRPALVVDGQHRLVGAAESDANVVLPVVAMPNSGWAEQIYQFIVINEKAQKVETSLLTDIFGSSLTKSEQTDIRDRLKSANVDVEARIAAVIAARDKASPFLNMVKLKLAGDASAAATSAYITDQTIRLLIDGTTRHSRGWRIDDELYELLARESAPERSQWESWTNGAWRNYWFSFWTTVRDYYNAQGEKEGVGRLWLADKQTNLTKAVTLRILQKLFIDKMVEEIQTIDRTRPILEEALGGAAAEGHLATQRQKIAFPKHIDDFPQYVRDRFLNFLPIRVFTKPWVKSLDDDQGRQNLYEELAKAFTRTKEGKTYYANNRDVFDIAVDVTAVQEEQ